MNTSELQSNVARALIANHCFTDAGLAEGTNSATFQNAATATFTINGIFYAKTATDNLAMSAGHTKLLSGYTQLFIVALDSAGAATTYQGLAYKSETDVVGATKYRGYLTEVNNGVTRHTKTGMLEEFSSAFLPTNVPDTVCPIGIIKIVASADFTPGTTDFGSQDTCYDISVVPARVVL
jgi:hypothetical protein